MNGTPAKKKKAGQALDNGQDQNLQTPGPTLEKNRRTKTGTNANKMRPRARTPHEGEEGQTTLNNH